MSALDDWNDPHGCQDVSLACDVIHELEKDLQIEKIFNNSSHKLIADRDSAIEQLQTEIKVEEKRSCDFTDALSEADKTIEQLERDKASLVELADMAINSNLDEKHDYYSSNNETVRSHIESELARLTPPLKESENETEIHAT